MDAVILDWQAAALAGPNVAGGKGWNLGRLRRYGFNVPNGGVVGVTLYRSLMAKPRLRPLLNYLHRLGAVEVDEPSVIATLDAIRQAIQEEEFSRDTVGRLTEALADWGLSERRVAVRSSATAEDGVEASFAGIHASLLNVKGVEAVLDALRGCYGSLWTPRALSYRRRLGLGDDEVGCAAVICEMVGGEDGPRCAGVAFSCEPRTGRRDLIVIAATHGLGEGLVGGRTNPEEIAVRAECLTLTIDSWRCAGKRVLTEVQALELARMAQRVQWDLGDGQEPQDIEWAYESERFWLLQARPVTRVPYPTFGAVAHLPVMWSNANIKEVLPGVLTVRSWSAADAILKHIIFAPYEAAGGSLPPGLAVVRRINGRAYFDLTAMQWAFCDGFGISPGAFNHSMGGGQPEIPVPRPTLRDTWRRQRNIARLLFALWRNERSLSRRMNELRARIARLAEDDLGALSNRQFWERLESHIGMVADFGPRLNLANASATGSLQWLEKTACRFCGEEEGKGLASGLLAGQGGVTSAEHGYAVYDLALAAAGDAEARQYLATEPPDPQGWRRLSSESPFRVAMTGFIAQYGHRTVQECEVAIPRWREDPSFILEQVRSLLESEGVVNPRAMAQSIRSRAEEKLARLPWPQRLLLRRLAGRARTLSALREEAKGILVLQGVPIRRETLEIGRRLVAAGHLDKLERVFHLAIADIEAYLRGDWSGCGAAALCADRVEQRQRRLAADPPDVLIQEQNERFADPPVLGMAVASPKAPVRLPPAQGRYLQGIGASGGIVGGVARVIRDANDARRLKAGEILVAPSTDPGWTPMFPRAAAVVTEIGGYLSHGAIVAREYGLPAVVNVPHLLEQVADGERIVVDGNLGRVTCERKAHPPSTAHRR
jgi:pyruvate,water dikinase